MEKETKTNPKKTKTVSAKTKKTTKTVSAKTKKSSEGTVKKTIKKTVAPKKVMLNETVNLEEKKEVTVENKPPRKRNDGFLIFCIILACVFVLAITISFFFEKNNTRISTEDYKASCIDVPYSEIVRVPANYKNKDIKMYGKVVEVTGYDNGYSNNMTIVIDANIFNESDSQIIEVLFEDSKYEHGFIAGDNVVVYGKYTKINGNTPQLEAKYIEINN